MLRVNDLAVNYDHVKAVKGISFNVHEDEIVSILGANGAGKSSTLLGLAGIVKRSGTVTFDNRTMTGKSSTEAPKSGLVLCPEGRHLFPGLTVDENLKLGGYLKGIDPDRLSLVYSLFPILKERFRQIAGSLSGGEQQMLAIGRALMANPGMLMLDEPSLGLAPKLIDSIFNVLLSLKRHMSVLLVEQNANRALEISDRAYILQNGRIVVEGSAQKLLHDDSVRAAYLGL